MANLDDFFKKKDGKKTKGKKFAVNNPLSLSASDKDKNGKVKQEKPTSFVNQALLENANDLFSSQTTDEWKDFVEEKKDYTGLKIQNLQLNDDDEEKANIKEQESEEETEVDDNGQTVVKKKQPSGPWKVIQEQKKEEVKEKVEEKPAPPPPAPVVKQAYIPPGRRNEGFDRNPSSSASKKADLPAKEAFPTLGSTVPNNPANQSRKPKTTAK
ncbi:protein CDV3 homolog [Planococcus citri]|uniref:protein CDV3 homolog n=1 Tax=Planococcus citri TaxID=170843 RepID=UPI0031F837EB